MPDAAEQDRTVPLTVLVSQADLDVMATFDPPSTVAQHAVDAAIENLRIAKTQASATETEEILVIVDTESEGRSFVEENIIALYGSPDRKVMVTQHAKHHIDKLRGHTYDHAILVGATTPLQYQSVASCVRSGGGKVIRIGKTEHLATGWRSS